ncbi:MAG: BACON domain-containing protein, partial [Acidobacteriaceae bacterium]|nr:BACON domain-containing protein [Acidobacteriaceae bacterium]
MGPTQLTFTSAGNGVTVSPQYLVVSATNGSAVSYTASATSTGNWLTVSPPSGTTPQALTVVVNAANLALGTYAGFITITSQSNAVTVPVTFNINAPGASPLTASASQLSFNFQTGNTVPQSQPLTVNSTSSGGTTFSATAVTNNGGNWLTVSPSLSTTGSTLTVAVNPATLSAGSYFGSIALNPPGTAGLVVPVNVTVSAPSTLTATPTQLSFAYQI